MAKLCNVRSMVCNGVAEEACAAVCAFDFWRAADGKVHPDRTPIARIRCRSHRFYPLGGAVAISHRSRRVDPSVPRPAPRPQAPLYFRGRKAPARTCSPRRNFSCSISAYAMRPRDWKFLARPYAAIPAHYSSNGWGWSFGGDCNTSVRVSCPTCAHAMGRKSIS